MAERMIEFVKNKIIDFKVRIKSHFAMESSFGHLMETSTGLYLMSVRIDEICEGIKNAFRLRRSLFNMICFIIFIVNLFLFSLSSYHYSKLKLKFLPDQMPMMIFLVGFVSIWISTIKIDLIISEMKNNLSPMKVFYSLIHNSGMTHKLTDSHYRQLAITSLRN